MAGENMAAHFARTSRNLLFPLPVVPKFDEFRDPDLARIEWAIARLPKRTHDAFLMHCFDNIRCDRIAHRLGITEKSVEREIVRTLRTIHNAKEGALSDVVVRPHAAEQSQSIHMRSTTATSRVQTPCRDSRANRRAHGG